MHRIPVVIVGRDRRETIVDANRPLAGNVTLITGAGRGFGLAIAERFAEAGADLALNYRASKDPCETLATRVRETGQRAIAVQADIADADAVVAMVERVIAAFGRVDVLVNNAGVMHLAPFVETTEAVWRAEMEVNVFGTMRVTHTVLPHMIAQRSGKIVNLSSQLALIGWDRAAVYAGGKGFILT
jgi:3-oxoacyl-[acyl-carrier protein] reductase